MNIQKITVFLKKIEKQKVGTLAIKDKKIYFEYDKNFLTTGIELSPYKLPLKAGLHRCDDDTFEGLWGVFNDSLPDGWGRLLMDRYFMNLGINLATVTPIDRLSYVGDYTMGALCYEPIQDLGNDLSYIDLDGLACQSQEILEGSSAGVIDELLSLNGSSSGARPKVLVQLSEDKKHIIHGRQDLKDGYVHWMVKFASLVDDKEIGAIEYAYSLMAKEAKLDMLDTALLEGENGRYFACERFDRLRDKRVHMHSVSGLVHSDFRYPSLDYDDLLSLTFHLTKNILEVEKVFRLACFNLFAHNRDDHAKNFSYIMDEKGNWFFSPIYDITFSLGVRGEHSMMYLGEGKNPTIENLYKLANKHQIKNSKFIIDEVKSAISQWDIFSNKANISKKMQKYIRDIMIGLQ